MGMLNPKPEVFCRFACHDEVIQASQEICMMSAPKITFIGAGSTIFVKNILGDVFHREALKTAHIALMDIDPTRLEESHIVVRKLMDSAGASGKITCHTQQKEALQDADFVVVAFQIGGYEPCTVTDFEVCKRHGLEQTIADTLGPGGIMRALRTIPHLWQICEDMTEVCPDATMLNYVNPMAMNTGRCMPAIRISNRSGCAIRCRNGGRAGA